MNRGSFNPEGVGAVPTLLDIDGESRFYGRPDIGADEHPPEVSAATIRFVRRRAPLARASASHPGGP
jgi:hypothetical protein